MEINVTWRLIIIIIRQLRLTINPATTIVPTVHNHRTRNCFKYVYIIGELELVTFSNISILNSNAGCKVIRCWTSRAHRVFRRVQLCELQVDGLLSKDFMWQRIMWYLRKSLWMWYHCLTFTICIGNNSPRATHRQTNSRQLRIIRPQCYHSHLGYNNLSGNFIRYILFDERKCWHVSGEPTVNRWKCVELRDGSGNYSST